jgi:hypothetical protein
MTALDWPKRMIGPNDFIYVIYHRLHTQFSCLIISASSWIREILFKGQIRSMGEVAPRWIMALEPLSGPHGRLDIWWPIVKCTCTREFFLKVTASLGLLSPPIPSLSKEILLNLGMKWWNSAFNVQGSRVILVVVQVRALKIYVAAT